jgi:hypothetical protein
MKIRKLNKLIIFLLIIIIFPSAGKSQNIENADFDSVCVCAIDRIYHWVTSDIYYMNKDTVLPFQPNQLYTQASMELHIAMNTVQLNYADTDSLGNVHSVKLFSRQGLFYPNGDIFKGFIFNGNHFYTDSLGNIDLKRCGSPFPYRPDSVKGTYKFEDSLSTANEYGKVKIFLKKLNTASNSIDTVGYAESHFELTTASDWSEFKLPITYFNNSVPDSVLVVFFSSSGEGNPTSLCLDDFKFTYPTSGIASSNETKIVIYPNPAHNKIYISSSNNKSSYYKIFGITGILAGSGAVLDYIDLSAYIKGFYLLKIYQPDCNSATFKIIKQ